MNYWRKVFAIAWKDTLSELRGREILFSVLVFTILVIIIFNFAFNTNQEMMNLISAGMLWVTFTFAGVLSLTRTFVPEKEQGCLEGLMICPVSRDVIYVGKMLTSLLFMLVVEAIALPIFSLLFNLPALSPPIIVITVLASIGFVAIGTLFSALAVNTRAREIVLPILFLPIVVPVVIAAVGATQMALAGDTWSKMMTWLQVIIAFDVVFLTVSVLVFNYVIEE